LQFKASLKKKLATPYLNEQARCDSAHLQSQDMGGKARRIMVQSQPQKRKKKAQDSIRKTTTAQKAGGVAQVVKCLPNKCGS
jgi:hypothetical protein